jgi:hypothetical protein
MRLKALTVSSALALLVVAAACEKTSPTRPSGADTSSASAESVTDARTGVTLIAAQGVSPNNGAQIPYASQPITLTVSNGVTTGGTALTYTFEVATDAAFSAKVYSKDGVAQGGGGRTSQVVDKLAGAKTYYWRVRVNSGSSAGPNSTARSFSVGPEVVLQTPVLTGPGATATGTATLSVANVQRSGPAGDIVYQFDVADTSDFGHIVFSTTVAEQSGTQTSVTVPQGALTSGATFYLRVKATDTTNSISTGYSTATSFQYIAFDMRKALIVDSPADLGDWPDTAQITMVQMTPISMEVDFTKRTGPGRWPEESFGNGGIQYTLGMCFDVGGNNNWVCSAVVQFWEGRELSASGQPSEIGRNWFYDGRWGPLHGYQPRYGELVGFFVGAGNLRDRRDPGYVKCPRVCERSNVVLLNFGDSYYLQNALRLQPAGANLLRLRAPGVR